MQLRPSILKVVAYFDLFSYPVSVEDVMFYLEKETEEKAVKQEIDQLVKEGCLFRVASYLSLRNDPSLAERRDKGRQHADELLALAGRGSRILYQFPFV